MHYAEAFAASLSAHDFGIDVFFPSETCVTLDRW